MAIPQYPQRAFRAVAYLFRAYNDIDVYVEDTASRNMYEVLINRMLDGRAVVERVVQVGNREQVLAACAQDQGASPRRRVYIIDGDFDLMLGRATPPLKHLHRLNVYSSENLLISEAAITEVAYECLSNTERAEVEKKVAAVGLIEESCRVFRPLFSTYAVARRLDDTIATSGVNVMEMCEQKGKHPQVSERKVRDRISGIRKELAASVGHAEVEKVEKEVETHLDVHGLSPLQYISGKTYFLPLVYHHLKEKANFRGSMEQLKVRLARYTDLAVDPDLQPRIDAVARGR